jgi:hypothetical protein
MPAIQTLFEQRNQLPAALPAALAALALLAATPAALAQANDDEDELEIPFDEAELFFELNDTDGDLGIHAVIDGEDWRSLFIEGPNEKLMLAVRARGMLRKQGLTELLFESAEPGFDDLAPEEFFERFPEGTYEIEALTLEGEELESEIEISHVMPAPPEITNPPTASCDDPVVVVPPVTLEWEEVVGSHPDIGTPGQPVEVERYEVALEREDLELFVELTDDITSFEVPPLFLTPGETKFEVLVKAENGNRTAVEYCFEIL